MEGSKWYFSGHGSDSHGVARAQWHLWPSIHLSSVRLGVLFGHSTASSNLNEAWEGFSLPGLHQSAWNFGSGLLIDPIHICDDRHTHMNCAWTVPSKMTDQWKTWPGVEVAQWTIRLTSTMVHWQTFTMNEFKWEMVECQIPLSLPAEVNFNRHKDCKTSAN